MATDPEYDRREGVRAAIPACETCGTATHMSVALRLDYAIYFRCAGCGRVTSQPKPQRPPIVEK